MMRNPTHTGISLIEVLLTLLVTSSIILPIGIMMTTGANTTTGVSSQFTRNSVAINIRDEIDPDRPSFYADYNQGTSQAITDNGFTVNYLRKVYIDSTVVATDDMKRVADCYIYDGSGNIFSKTTNTYVSPEIRIDVGNLGDTNNKGGLMDSAHRNWVNDNNVYNNANQVYGVLTGSTGTVGSAALTVTGVSTTDKPIFQTYREATTGPVQYSFDLINGNYTLQLYFTELVNNGTINGTTNRRRADITINGTTVDTNYSPYESTGNYLIGEVRSYPVTITGNKLDVIVKDAVGGTEQHARLMGLAISKNYF